jgi:CRP/FNR family transcriptional regulator
MNETRAAFVRAFLQKKLTFWDRLDERDKKLLLDNTAEALYPKDAIIADTWNECPGVLMVQSGGLRVSILSEDGREITLYRLRPGGICILSASCLIRDITFDVTIDAEMDTEALLTDISTWSKLQTDYLEVENFSLRLTAEKFSDVMWAMQQILFMRFDRRLATFLLGESAKNGSDEVGLTHEQIAKYVGSAREVVSRMLKHFESEGLVCLRRGGVTLIDKTGLRSLL